MFVDGAYGAVLSRAVGGVRGLVKRVDKRTDRAMRVRGEEAVGNLQAFVAYRKGLKRG